MSTRTGRGSNCAPNCAPGAGIGGLGTPSHWFSVLNCLAALLVASCSLWSADFGVPASWIPARWDGGPLELEHRDKAENPPADASLREVIAKWYDTATLSLLEGSPVNCLLVTWSTGTDSEVEHRQQALVKSYASEAHRKGIAVLGLVYGGSDASNIALAAGSAGLDGLVLEGQFPETFADQIAQVMHGVNRSAVVISIARESQVGSERISKKQLVAVEGISPSARNLADMGIRSGPSSEPWIQSNAWLVRSFPPQTMLRSIWISYRPQSGTAFDYARSVADAAIAGGRWIVSLDDRLRANLRNKQAAAVNTWDRIGACLRFAEEHPEWRGFDPYGNLAIIVDASGVDPEWNLQVGIDQVSVRNYSPAHMSRPKRRCIGD